MFQSYKVSASHRTPVAKQPTKQFSMQLAEHFKTECMGETQPASNSRQVPHSRGFAPEGGRYAATEVAVIRQPPSWVAETTGLLACGGRAFPTQKRLQPSGEGIELLKSTPSSC